LFFNIKIMARQKTPGGQSAEALLLKETVPSPAALCASRGGPPYLNWSDSGLNTASCKIFYKTTMQKIRYLQIITLEKRRRFPA
jgi:hypothetical protein